jgi:hypothetical protein
MASNVLQNYEQLSYGSAGLSMHRAKAVQVIGDAVATHVLTAKEAGSLCLFDSAAGVVYTLPPPVAGMQFTFATVVTITSNSAKVLTDSASTFLTGGAVIMNSGATTGEMFAGNGTTHRSTNGNGSTTGGIIGDRLTFTAISSTVWFVDAVFNGTGTVATPFATS